MGSQTRKKPESLPGSVAVARQPLELKSLVRIQAGQPLFVGGNANMHSVRVVVEKCEDGYIAYPLGLKGVVVGQGHTYEEALADVKSAIQFHVETFGREVLETESPVLEAFIAEAVVNL